MRASDGEPHAGEVMEGAGGVSSSAGRTAAHGPPRQVVHRVGGDAERMRRDQLLEPRPRGRRTRPAPAGRPGAPARRSGGRSWRVGRCPRPAPAASSALTRRATWSPVGAVAEAEPLQAVDDRGDGARSPARVRGRRSRTAAARRRHRAGGRRCRGSTARRGRRRPHRCRGRRPARPTAAAQPASATRVIATSICRRHRVRGRVGPRPSRSSRSSDRSGVPLSAPKVRITAAATPMSSARTGSTRQHRVRGVDEDAVRLRRRADVDLDVPAQPSRCRTAGRGPRSLPGSAEQGTCPCRLPARPGAACRGEASGGRGARRRWTAPRPARTPPARRRAHHAAATARQRRPALDEASTRSASGPLGREGAVPDLTVPCPDPASASASARCARRRSPSAAAW